MPKISTKNQVISDQEKKDSEYQKLSFKDFFSISVWILKLLFKLFPLQAVFFLIGEVTMQMRELINSYLFALVIDALIRVSQDPTPDIRKIYPYVGYLLIYEIVATVIRFIHRSATIDIRNKGRPLVRQAYYLKLKELGIQTLEQPDVSNKIHRSAGYIGGLFQQFFGSVSFLAVLIKAFSVVALVVAFAPEFVAILVVVYIPLFFFDKAMRGKIYKFGFETTEDSRKADATLSDISHPRTLPEIYITQAFEFLDKKYMQVSMWLANTHISLLNKWRLGSSVYGLALTGFIIYTSLDVMKKGLTGQISIGQVTFWMRTLFSLNNTLDSVMSNFNDLLESALYYKDIYTIFQTQPAVKDGSVVMHRLKTGPSVEFNNVTFHYPNAEKLVLKNLDLKIEPEQKIAIVGYNGAGKTTLVKLICRFYQPTDGKILINNENVADLRIDSLYKNMGVLFQEYNTYPQLSVKENIWLGNSTEPLSEQKMEDAAMSADSTGFIGEYKNKFNQILSERYKDGIRPSTGQWQKLAIARFFYRNAPLVIFDEPTASIDAVSEYNIFNRIYSFFKGKTVIIISHRFSTVRNADRILVLDNGTIVEDGSHDQLIKKDGFYAKSFKLQAEGYRESTESLM